MRKKIIFLVFVSMIYVLSIVVSCGFIYKNLDLGESIAAASGIVLGIFFMTIGTGLWDIIRSLNKDVSEDKKSQYFVDGIWMLLVSLIMFGIYLFFGLKL